MSEPLLPVIDEESAPFWEGTRAGELRVQRCRDTGRLFFPPRATSPWGEHAPPEWTAVSGRGAIWSFVVPHPPLLAYFAERASYNVVVVELEEDPRVRMVGNLVATASGGIDSVDPTAIEIGALVRVVFDPIAADVTLPRWVFR